MPGPTVAHSGSGGANAGGTTQTFALQLTTGNSSYVAVFENTSSAPKATSVTDGQGNSYTKEATFTIGNLAVTLWVADGIVGAASVTVTVHFSASPTMAVYIGLDVAGAANPSFDKASAGHGNASSYVSGTAENESLAPSSDFDLLLLLMDIAASTTAGAPTVSFSSETGETLVASRATTSAVGHTNFSGAIYSKPASGHASQAITGAATLSGTGVAGNGFGVLAIGILPAPVPGEIGLSVDAAVKASSKGTGEIGLAVDATTVASSKATGEARLALDATTVASSRAKGEIGLSLDATTRASSKAKGEIALALEAAILASSKAKGELGLSVDSTVTASSKTTGTASLDLDATVTSSSRPKETVGLSFSAEVFAGAGGGGWADWGEFPPKLSPIDVRGLRLLNLTDPRATLESLGFVSVTHRPDGSERPLEEIPSLVRQVVHFEESETAPPPPTKIVYVDRVIQSPDGESKPTSGIAIILVLVLLLLLLSE